MLCYQGNLALFFPPGSPLFQTNVPALALQDWEYPLCKEEGKSGAGLDPWELDNCHGNWAVVRGNGAVTRGTGLASGERGRSHGNGAVAGGTGQYLEQWGCSQGERCCSQGKRGSNQGNGARSRENRAVAKADSARALLSPALQSTCQEGKKVPSGRIPLNSVTPVGLVFLQAEFHRQTHMLHGAPGS